MARGEKNGNNNNRKFTTQGSVNTAIKSICDIMRRSNCTGTLQYVPIKIWVSALSNKRELKDEHL